MTYLLDTCFLSDSIATRPNPGVVAWLRGTAVSQCYISAITVGEIRRGIEKLPDPHPRKARLNQWLENDLLTRFQGRVVAVDAAVMLEWGRWVASLERQGRTLPLIDSLIAAQAIFNRLNLVTRNEKDFRGTGVAILNPWE